MFFKVCCSICRPVWFQNWLETSVTIINIYKKIVLLQMKTKNDVILGQGELGTKDATLGKANSIGLPPNQKGNKALKSQPLKYINK